ncbi:MAG: hypothetical protein H7Z14_11970 [Anaerolineae bacterium]|nr:hypothetical protein [Phycisphaerae bacterium]
MRSRSRIVSAILMFLLVPAFAQVLSARVLLRCADGRECFPPPIVETKCETESASCCRAEPATLPIDRSHPCVWTLVPGLDVNHAIFRSPIAPPALLAIADRHVLAVVVAHAPHGYGRAVEHVPIASQQVVPGEGVGPRSPPSSSFSGCNVWF